MQMNDSELLREVSKGFERGRAGLALQAMALALVVPVAAAVVRFQGLTSVLLGLGVVSLVAVCVWRGQGLSTGALHGLKAGLVPLVFSLAANAWGHVCIPGQGCSSLCVPACVAGGVLAGLAIEWWARQSQRPMVVRLSGASVSLLTGALGCACVGSSGIIGLVGGYVGASLAGLTVRWVTRRTPAR